ncbi:hypothetical protein CY34DRAFT_658720 [Suillus luteus UH-Slu-Lm8-n1]|uniref:Uncharacterized protein n=1 Tax=Suillus luteus UH-Slu-Lm8-n1 TaxID=930992 RepID=A0A0D0AQ61_9AGAM|nr:hypothetical protein CY34DRAFT_658720 [Suillus luteus UH-Slu-Lm8-n1]
MSHFLFISFARSLECIHSVQRDSGLSRSIESKASPESPMSSGVLNDASSPVIVARPAAPTTFHTRVPINGPDLSSSFPTPSPETSIEESFSRTNDSNSRSWTASQPRRDGHDQNMSKVSLRAFPNSLLNPIPPSTNNPTHKPAPLSLLSAFRSIDSRSNPAPSQFLSLPPTSTTSGSSDYNDLFPVSRIVSIAPTPLSSSHSFSTHTTNMHLASPPPTPTTTLTQAHPTASHHILPQVYKNTGGDVDYEGPCVDSEMRHYEHYGRRSQGTDFQEQSAEEDTQDQRTIIGSTHMSLNMSSGEIGTLSPPFSGASAPEAQPEVPTVPPPIFEMRNQSKIADLSRLCFDTSSGELDYRSPSPGANAEASPHLDEQLEGRGVEKEVPVSAIEVEDQSTIVDSQCMRLDRPCGELDHPSRSFEANAEASPHVHEAQLEGSGIEPEVALSASEAHSEELGGEPKSTQSTPRAKSKSLLSHPIDLDALQRLIDSLNEPGYGDSGECGGEQSLQIEHECEGLDGTLEESFKSAEERPEVSLTTNDTPKPLAADTRDACPREYRSEKPADSEDSAQPEAVLSELHQPTPSDLTCLNADYLNQFEELCVEDSREQTPAESLLRDEEAVAAALIAPSPSVETESPPLPPSLDGLSTCLPLQSGSEALCLGVQLQGDGPPSQEPTGILDGADDFFTTFIDFMNSYTDGATSALRSTYTEDPLEQEPEEKDIEHEHAATIDQQVHVESETTISAELAAPLEHAGSVHSPPTIATPLPCALPSSISCLSRSLSPLSSLGESPMPQEGQDEIGSELHRIDSLDSDEDFGAYQRRARAGSSVSVLRRKTLLRSLQAGELRGGPDVSIEELSMLAKKDPHKIMISELKRKLEPSESMTQSRPPRKKTHQLQYQGARDPMPQSSDPSEPSEDVMSLQVESISAPMEVDSANVIGTTAIIEPAQTFVTTSEMTEPEPATNSSELWEDSISREKRARSLSWKASQATTQKSVEQPERNRKPKSQRPQKRKSKSLTVQEEAQICQWPAKSEQDGSFQRQFVQCDKSVFLCHFILWSFLSSCSCDLWYHFDCAGICEGDPRLEEPDSVFICPPCLVSSRCSCLPCLI